VPAVQIPVKAANTDTAIGLFAGIKSLLTAPVASWQSRRQYQPYRSGVIMFRRPSPPPTTRLPLGQTRVVHASAGFQLQVVHGRLWVTQPNCAQDIFLSAGQSLALQQDWVVVQADQPAQNGDAEYQLLRLR
jgi:Protein of unknown function (DUF2917)